MNSDSEREQGGIARRGAVMAAGALASRVSGFGRTAAIGAVLGAGAVGDAYATATMLPGIVYEVLLGGTLAGVLVPLLVRAHHSDRDAGDAYSQRLITLGVLVFGAVSVAAVLAVPALVELLSTGRTSNAGRNLVTAWSYVVVPTIFCYGIAALLTAVLNARDRFALPTWAPMINNATLIATAVVFAFLPGPDPLTAESITPAQIWVLGGGTFLGVALQAVVLWPAVRRAGLRWRWRFDLRALQLGQLAGLGGWIICYVAVSQIGVFVVLALVKAAGDRGSPGPFIYGNGWLMLMMGYGVAALPIITALQPRLGATAADRVETARRYANGLRLLAFLSAPVGAVFVSLGTPIAIVLFAWHRYTPEQAADTGPVIAAAGLSLLPYAVSQAQTFAFYALSDARTPALLNIPVVALRVGIDVVLFFNVSADDVAMAMMAGNGISYIAACLAGGWLLRRRMQRPSERSTTAHLAKIIGAATAASGLTILTAFGVAALAGSGKGGSLVQVAVGGLVLVAVYLRTAILIRIPEARRVMDALPRLRSARALKEPGSAGGTE